MDENGFKTKVFGGFDKNQVLTYLDDVHQGFNEKSAQMQSQINEVSAECEQLAASVEISYNRNIQLQSEITELLSKNDQAGKKLTECKEQLKRTAFEAESMRRKCEKYDGIHQNINGLILEAKGMSDKIVSDAKAEAKRLLSGAQSNAQSIVDEARRKAEQITFGAEEGSKRLNQNLNGVKNDVNVIKSGLQVMTRQVEDKLREIERAIERAEGGREDFERGEAVKPQDHSAAGFPKVAMENAAAASATQRCGSEKEFF